MNQEKKDAMIASIENVEAIEEFLSEWYSVADLFETAANAGSVIIDLAAAKQLTEDDMKVLNSLIDQHILLANILKKFEPKQNCDE